MDERQADHDRRADPAPAGGGAESGCEPGAGCEEIERVVSLTHAVSSANIRNERERFMALLKIPPVVSAETAVRVQIVKDVKGKK